MDLVRQVALVPETPSVALGDLMRVSAALQRQVARDVAPIWGIQATVGPFATLEDVPLGHWPVILVENVQGGAGVHLDKDGQPFALVEWGPSWSLTASHETIEMLIDPYGSRTVPGSSPKPGQGRVEFLVEACDPCEAEEFAYTVNGVLVSDFYTPRYFDPMRSAGTRYSYAGSVTEPRQVLRGGYLSWHEPISDHWWQLTWFGPKPSYRDLGTFAQDDPRSLRELVDRATPEMQALGQLRPGNVAMAAARATRTGADRAAAAKAEAWRKQIQELAHAAVLRRGPERRRRAARG